MGQAESKGSGMTARSPDLVVKRSAISETSILTQKIEKINYEIDNAKEAVKEFISAKIPGTVKVFRKHKGNPPEAPEEPLSALSRRRSAGDPSSPAPSRTPREPRPIHTPPRGLALPSCSREPFHRSPSRPTLPTDDAPPPPQAQRASSSPEPRDPAEPAPEPASTAAPLALPMVTAPSAEDLERAERSSPRLASAPPSFSWAAAVYTREVPDGFSKLTATSRVDKFERLLKSDLVDLDQLRELAWTGVPPALRPRVWRLLLGYEPAAKSRQLEVLQRRREEYREMRAWLYEASAHMRSEEEVGTLRQIRLDTPRTSPGIPFFHEKVLQEVMERVLYIRAIRNPAYGYVQGINDLLIPFIAVFFSERLAGSLGEDWEAASLSSEQLAEIEADCFYCLGRILDQIQDHYTYAQPGIQRKVFRVKELCRRIDEPLVKHLEDQGLEFIQFVFRWINCLLVRELPLAQVVRLWDTYIADGDDFAEFVTYVAVAFLLHFAPQLRAMEFQDAVMFLQKLPTRAWGEREMEAVLSQAYMYRESFRNTPSHFAHLAVQ